jgi:hypothetical protein
MAIGNRQYQGGYLYIAFTSFNNIGMEMKFDPNRLLIVDIDGNEYTIDKDQTDKLEAGITKETTIKVDARMDYDLAYKISKSVKVSHMSYEMADGTIINKYFP